MATSIEKRKKAAEKYVSKGKIEAAIKEYTKVLEETPKDINILNRLGDLHARIKRTDEAARLFTGIAEQYTDEGFFVKAIAIYKKIIKLDPSRLEIYEKLAELYHKQGLINEARTQYQVLADYYLKHDNAASAISIYQNMVRLEPDNPSHHAKLAELYHQQKLPEKAIERYQTIADIMLRHGQGDQAGQVFERAFDVHSGIDFVSSAIGKLREAGHQGIAARVLAKAMEHNPEARSLLSGDLAPPEPAPPTPTAVPPTPAPTVADEPGDATGVEDVGVEDRVAPRPAVGDDLQAAMAAAAASVGDEAADVDESDGDASPLDLELEDFNEDEPESLIRPPEDMADDEVTGLGFNREFKAGMETTGFSLADADDAFDLDLDDVAAEEPAPAAVDVADLEEEIELEIELEDTSFELEPAVTSEPATDEPEDEEETPALAEDDILSEAEVMTKYGLREKALERIHQVLSHNDRNLMAHRLLIQMHLDDEDAEEVQVVAERMAGIAVEVGDQTEWPQVREMLQAAGYGIAELAEVPAEEPVEVVSGEVVPDEPVPGEAVPAEVEPIEVEAADLAEAEVVEVEVQPIPSEPAPSGPIPSEPAEPVAQEPAPAPFSLGDLSDDEPVIADVPAAAQPATEPAADMAAGLTAESATPTTDALDAALADAAGGVVPRPAASPASVEEAAASIEREVAASELFAESNSASGVVVELPAEQPVKSGGRSDRITRLLDNLLEETSGRKKKKSATEKALEEMLSETLGARPKAKSTATSSAPAPPAAPAAAPAAGSMDSTAPVTPVQPAAQPEFAPVEAAPVEAAPVEAAPVAPVPAAPAQPAAARTSEPGAPVKVKARPAIDADDVSDIDDALSFLEPMAPADPAPAPAPAQTNLNDTAASGMDDTSPATFEDTGMSWLDEVADGQPGQAADDNIFEDEEGFFDLANELGDELGVGVFDPKAQAEPPEEQSLDEIISGFKRGVAENLGSEDVDTHFNLGIAYREMGLLDEAIGEFQVAAKGESYLVQSCSMLGMCFQEKGLPELAIKWYTRGLAAPGVSENDSLALLYDLGSAYLATGDTQKARQTFVEVYGINSNYRDVSAKLASIPSGG